MYWDNGSFAGSIGRANVDGSAVNQSFITGASEPSGVALDAGHIYWGASGYFHFIGRSNRDGSAVNQNFIAACSLAGCYQPLWVAVDASHVYWAGSNGAIGRANLDGSAADVSFITTTGLTRGVAVDARYIYWATGINSPPNSGSIVRANLDGSAVNPSFITGANVPDGVALDAGHIYWANNSTGSIGRANLDGTAVNQNFITGISDPSGVAVDAGHIYWASGNLTGSIGRANLDGTAVNQNFITGISSPNGVAVDTLAPDIQAENVEITQGIQNLVWGSPTTVGVPGYGAVPGGSYSGVPLVKDVATVVRVYASVASARGDATPQQGVTAELHAYRGSPGALAEIAGSPIPATPRSLAVGLSLPSARVDPAGAYTFTLPAAWTEGGPITLVADINPAVNSKRPITECAGCTDNNEYALSGIPFKTTGPVTIRPFQIVYKYPNARGHGYTTVRGPDLSSLYQRARDLLPLAPNGLVVQPYPQAVLDISPQVQRVVRFWRATNHIALSKPDLSDCVAIPICRGDIEAREYEALVSSMTLAHTGHTYLAGFEAGVDGATWTAKGVTLIGGADNPPRPLTSTAHELLHLIGFKHAGQNCPGTGVGNSQQGVPWPPDNRGYVQGVGLDRRPNSGGAGVYKIIAPGVGQPQWYDLMSYCANFDADAWLSTVNWSKFVATDPATAAPASDKSLATPAAAGRITVDAALVTGGKPTLLGASTTTAPATRSTSSRYHIKALGSRGHVIANVGVAPQQIDDSPLMMLTATLPGAGATTLKLTTGSHVMATLHKPTPAPSVRLTIPRGGLKVAHHKLTIRWRAKGARRATLTATVQYETSRAQGWQTLVAGLTGQTYAVPLAMFNHATRVHTRVVISDGFSTAVATSGPIRLPRR